MKLYVQIGFVQKKNTEAALSLPKAPGGPPGSLALPQSPVAAMVTLHGMGSGHPTSIGNPVVHHEMIYSRS